MSRAVHLVTNNVGYPPLEGRCLLCPGSSRRAVAASPCCSLGKCKTYEKIRITSKGTSFMCNASSNGHRRHPEFSQQSRQAFSRNKNRQNEDRDSFENFEESRFLSSKNGSFSVLSNTPKFQATATPGPREKEIVELFRKVQAQLRERAAIKEEKKIEAMQRKGKESETVDSLLKLLRKHSVEQGKRKTSRGDFLDNSRQNDMVNGEKTTGFFDSINSAGVDLIKEPKASGWSRPVSNFRRKSPVPQSQHPSYYRKGILDSAPRVRKKASVVETHVDLEPEPEAELYHEVELDPESGIDPQSEVEPEPEIEPEAVFSDVDVYDEVSDEELLDSEEVHVVEYEVKPEPIRNKDFNALKLTELRALAKSHGMKGFSKLKKGELVELLNRNMV